MDNRLGVTDDKISISAKLSDAYDLLVKSAKIASLFGAVSGFAYLFSYTTHVGIPFPLELSVLPTTLLIVGLTSIVGTFIVLAGMFLPALTLDYNDQVTKGYRNADDIRADVQSVRFIRYFFCTWVPTALALTGVILSLGIVTSAASVKLIGSILIFISACWIFYTPKYVGVFLDNRWQYFLVNFVQIALSIIAYSFIISISVAVFPDFGKWSVWSGCSIALVVFTLFQVVVFVPTTQGKSGKILLPPHFNHKTSPTMGLAFVLAAVWTAMTVFMPQVNFRIGGAALYAFHVGGNIPIAICLKTKPAAAISQRLNFDADYCSEELSLKLDSGDRVYVSKLRPANGSTLSGTDEQSMAIYFRQDEIKQKIYFREKGRAQAG